MSEPGCCPSKGTILDYVFDALEEEQNRSVAEHLAICPSCGALVSEYNIVLMTTRPRNLPDPGEGFNRLVWRKIENRRARKRTAIALLPALAAAIALIIILPTRRTPVPSSDQFPVEDLELYRNMDLIEQLDLIERFEQAFESEKEL